jgi:hypothetical protein
VGRRSRSRSQPPAPRAAARPAPPSAGGRERATARLPATRRALVGYLGAAAALAVAVLLGIVVIGGKLGPLVVLVCAALGAWAIQRRARQRLAGLPFTDEDRVLQTLAGGMLVLSVGLAAVAALVLALR